MRIVTSAALLVTGCMLAKLTLEQRPIRRSRGPAWPAPAARHAAAVAAALDGHVAAWEAVRIGGTLPNSAR